MKFLNPQVLCTIIISSQNIRAKMKTAKIVNAKTMTNPCLRQLNPKLSLTKAQLLIDKLILAPSF